MIRINTNIWSFTILVRRPYHQSFLSPQRSFLASLKDTANTTG